ncbi:carboxypeptidase-like regulatory domain-containing protein [Cohnella zeiphila]|uniref:Carboxypeptidase regulatory-like domain-containing protein n=1 Tax=Cohnella zeiphila TaxID=2761120 RepID=A0A7X0SMD3_9BACL|nr:carboxypeptidase-like regulatory domain-containing protein [Cohnella zeiphila]MBB6732650.1 carboxypeptidase regulatory-like domain-containing protein [Cohnella zeiphila]
MKRVTKSAALLLLAAGLAGCSGNNDEAATSATSASSAAATPAVSSPAAETAEAHLDLDQTSYTLKQWKNDGSHTVTTKGKLLLGDQPVANAVIHVGDSLHDIVTGEDGSFEILVDQSLLSQVPVHVVSLDKATVGGQPVAKDAADQLMSASSYLNVYYPIQTTKAEASAQDPNQVEVHGKVVSNPGDVISFFQIDKYRIGGIVKDANGNPVKDAVVWIDRDEGEGFAKSTPTDAAGRYYMYYLPEDDEGTNLTVTTDDGKNRYTLPEGRVFYIPDHTSVDINITLPKDGNVIVDKPPTLEAVTSPGAMYTGILVGLNVPSDVSYSVTIPDKEGNFALTVPKDVWDRNPTFFETKMTKFVENRTLTWGDTLESSFLEPGANDPKTIEAKPADA